MENTGSISSSSINTTDSEALFTINIERPSFRKTAKDLSYCLHNLLNNSDVFVDLKHPNLTKINGAIPHRSSWASLRDRTTEYLNDQTKLENFRVWTNRLIEASGDKIDSLKKFKFPFDLDKLKNDQILHKKLVKLMQKSHDGFIKTRDPLLNGKISKKTVKKFGLELFNFHINIPSVGPHSGVNNEVGRHTHLNVQVKRKPKPDLIVDTTGQDNTVYYQFTDGSRVALQMTADGKRQVAVTKEGRIIATDGRSFAFDNFSPDSQSLLEKHPKKPIQGYKPDAKFG